MSSARAPGRNILPEGVTMRRHDPREVDSRGYAFQYHTIEEALRAEYAKEDAPAEAVAV